MKGADRVRNYRWREEERKRTNWKGAQDRHRSRREVLRERNWKEMEKTGGESEVESIIIYIIWKTMWM